MMKFVLKDSPPPLRIADILLLDDSQDDGDSSMMDGCTGVLSRWLSRFRRPKLNRISLQNDKTVPESTAVDVINGDDSFTTDPQNRQSASKNELDKMEKLRAQMEMLLQNAKKELQLEENFTNPFESNDIFAYSTTDVQGLESNCHLSPQTPATPGVLPESSTIMACDKSLNFDKPKSEKCLEEMDQLEAELEAELQRFLLEHPQPERIKVTVQGADSVRSRSLSSGEVIDPREAYAEEVNGGVPPNELERRLHEVLEARQQEQIRELEAALEYARHKLHEKELEASWWKDTAKLISQHIPGPSRLISEHDGQEKYHFLR